MGVGIRVEAALRFAGGTWAGRIRVDVVGNPVRHSVLEQLREPSIGRESLDRGAELCARACIGRQVQSGQRGKEPDRRVAAGMLAQPLEHADVQLQKPPPRFFQAATTEQRGDRSSRFVD